MEWVETTAKTVEEAQDLALDKLGVDELEAEFEVLEEPRQGLFGRVRGEARVRARVAPKTPREKEDRGRRRRKPKSDNGGGRSAGKSKSENTADAPAAATTEDDSSSDDRGGSNDRGGRKNSGGNNRKRSDRRPEKKEDSPMEEVTAAVEGFLSGLTEAFELDGPVELDTSNDEIMAHIRGKHGLLLGPKARTLDAIQELTRVTAQRTAPSSIRIKVDVGGYREQRKVALQGFAAKAADKAVADGTEVVLEAMSSADRKTVHDALNDHEGVSTRSAGTDPRRYVIVVPNDSGADAADSEDADES